jgi:hypothetical protein
MMAGPSVTSATADAQLAALVDSFAPDPVTIGVGFLHATFVAACAAEQAGLPDPYTHDPELYFRWEVDETHKEIWLRPRTASARHRFIAKSCVDFLGLNREELRRWRWTLVYKNLVVLRDVLKDLDGKGVTSNARKITADGIREMMASDQPYAGMVRYFVNTLWTMNLLPKRIAAGDVEAAFALVCVGADDLETASLGVLANHIPLIGCGVLLMLRGHAHVLSSAGKGIGYGCIRNVSWHRYHPFLVREITLTPL